MDWYGEIDEVWLFGGPVTTAQVSNLYTYNSLAVPTAPEPATLALLGAAALWRCCVAANRSSAAVTA